MTGNDPRVFFAAERTLLAGSVGRAHGQLELRHRIGRRLPAGHGGHRGFGDEAVVLIEGLEFRGAGRPRGKPAIALRWPHHFRCLGSSPLCVG